MGMKTLRDMLFPAQCATCDTEIDAEFGLCPSCWAETHFIGNGSCSACAQPLVGDVEAGDLCDSCLAARPVWGQGRAALTYASNGRKLVLALKHGDRTELAKPAGRWIADTVRPMASSESLIVPVPLHWTRLVKRRYNQSELLAVVVGKALGLDVQVNGLKRVQRTRCLDGMNPTQRETEVANKFAVPKKHVAAIRGRHIVLIDDVLTTGATLSACSRALYDGGAKAVDVAVLARVAPH